MGREEMVVRVDLRRLMPPLQAQLVYRFHPPPFAMLVELLCSLPFEALVYPACCRALCNFKPA